MIKRKFTTIMGRAEFGFTTSRGSSHDVPHSATNGGHPSNYLTRFKVSQLGPWFLRKIDGQSSILGRKLQSSFLATSGA